MHTQSLNFNLVLVCVLFSADQSVKTKSSLLDVFVKVHTDRAVQVVDDRFVGVTLDTSLIADGWGKFNFTSQKLINLARELSPTFVRVGGTAADRLVFDPLKNTVNKANSYPLDDDGSVQFLRKFYMSAKDWDLLNTFTTEVGWDLIFDLNVLLRKHGRWNPSNAVQLLTYSITRGYNVAGFELGNEPDSFHHVFNVTVTPQQLADDVFTLQNILRKKFPYFKSSLVVGPDTTQVKKKRSYEYLQQFLQSEPGQKVDAATWHHYYVNGRIATLQDFIDPSILESLKSEIILATDLTRRVAMGTPVWLGETSSAYGGGAKGLSDVYVAGFMWLDKLGLSALFGLKRVLRQSFYKGLYSLLDYHTLDPNPDYWLTLLYKRLVGSAVFNATSTDQSIAFRVYAHCTKTHNVWGYPAGSVTLYVLNLHSESVNMSLPQFDDQEVDLFLLTPDGDQSLKSRFVLLNDKRLELTADSKLPVLEPQKLHSSVIFPAFSFGFVVVPQAQVKSCQTLSNISVEKERRRDDFVLSK
ncbi:heparanase-like [Gigantopelta aegis]|uniref:heparanase-like n=1 Tax=Gigantopelta aegis TaxID=1735272 RepID=UPI001B88C28C|nr:heparanase-like [Gigantopelta aegis]